MKVKGHSHEEGNGMVDKLAGYAQKGGAKNEQDDRQALLSLSHRHLFIRQASDKSSTCTSDLVHNT
eukprot:COSAG02_NODE_152_length_33208_cov_13.316591_2_plen_66_part_00